MAFFDSYKNINRGGITKDSKTATKDALEWACQVPACKPDAMKIVKALLDFKALQSNDASAERSLGDLGYHVRRCNKAREEGSGVQELTERSLHELVRNRSAIFKKELPATFKELVKRLLLQPGSEVLIDKNTARILRSNGLISEQQARTAPDSSVAVRIDPRELAEFFNESGRSWSANEQRFSSCWSLSEFMRTCAQDLSRHGSSESEKRALVHLTVQVSEGLLGAHKFIQGGQGINYRAFHIQAKAHADQYMIYPGFNEAIKKLDVREQILPERGRFSEHLASRSPRYLTADAARNPPQYQVRPNNNPYTHQPVRAVAAGNQQTRIVDAEEGKTNRALLICGARTQTVIGMIEVLRKRQHGEYVFNEAEQDLLDRVADCVAPYAGQQSPDVHAELKLCVPENPQVTTTQVETSTKIVCQTHVREIHIPGCQPFERFYLVQERKIRFHWDERVNFIKADIIDHSPWRCSTTAPNPTEVIF